MRGSRGTWQAGPGSTFSSGDHGISKAQITTQRSHWDTVLHTPNTDPEPMQLTPKGAVMGGPWQYKHIKQAHVRRTPQALLLHPSIQAGSFFFIWLSHALQVNSSQTLSLQQCKAQQEKQPGVSSTSNTTARVGFSSYKVASNLTHGHFGQQHQQP